MSPVTMTPMSEPRRANDRDLARKSATVHDNPVVARTLHGNHPVVRVLPLLIAGGCVIPPSLSVDNSDAGVDSPPAIVSVRSDLQELPEPGPVVFEQGAATQLNLTLVDTDLADTLYVRVFVGYNDPVLGLGPDPTPPRSTCTAPSGTAQRSASCDLTGLCQTQDVNQNRGMTIVVFDRQPVDDGSKPLFQHTQDNAGMSTSRFYYLKCQPRS